MTVTRRNILVAASAGVGGLLLAACSGSAVSGSAPTTAAAGSDSGGPGSGGSAATGAQPTPASDSRSAATSKAGGPGTVLTPLANVPVGGAVSATGKDGARLIVAQPAMGTVVAFSAICTHQGCTVVPAESTLNCPCHGSVFATATGAVVTGPAPSPLPEVAVTISGTNVIQT